MAEKIKEIENKEFNLLLRNCEEKFTKLVNMNILSSYEKFNFRNSILPAEVYISNRQAEIGLELKINNMKKYLGVWKR